MKKLFNYCLATFAMVSAMSCNNEDDVNQMQEETISVGPNQLTYGLTENNELVAFNANNPSTFS